MDAESNEETTYEPLEDRRMGGEGHDVDTAPPRDNNGILYVALLAAGIAFVLPYNRYAILLVHI